MEPRVSTLSSRVPIIDLEASWTSGSMLGEVILPLRGTLAQTQLGLVRLGVVL